MLKQKKKQTKQQKKKKQQKKTKITTEQINKNKNQINININSNNKSRSKSATSSSATKPNPAQAPSIIFNPSLVTPQPIYQQYPKPVTAPVSAVAPVAEAPRYISEAITSSTSEPARTTTGVSSISETARSRSESMGSISYESVASPAFSTEFRYPVEADTSIADRALEEYYDTLERLQRQEEYYSLMSEGIMERLKQSDAPIISESVASISSEPAKSTVSLPSTTFKRVIDLSSDESKNGPLPEPPTSSVRYAELDVVPVTAQVLIRPKDEELNLPEAEARLIVYRKPRGPNKSAEEKQVEENMKRQKQIERENVKRQKQIQRDAIRLQIQRDKEDYKQLQQERKAFDKETQKLEKELSEKLINDLLEQKKIEQQLSSLPSEVTEKRGRGRPKGSTTKKQTESSGKMTLAKQELENQRKAVFQIVKN